MHRPTIGVVTAALFGIAIVLRLLGREDTLLLEFACWRVGLVTAMWWIAHPQLSRLPSWLAGLVLAIVLAASWRPKILWVAIPLLIALWMLRPREPKPRPERRQRTPSD